MLVRSDDGQTRKLEVGTAARIWGELQAGAKKKRGGRKRTAAPS
jgi:hypothetical protein